MKVIKNNAKRDMYTTQVQCTGKRNDYINELLGKKPCGSLLKVDVWDIRPIVHVGDVKSYWAFTCPCCGATTDLDDDELPLVYNQTKKMFKKKQPEVQDNEDEIER